MDRAQLTRREWQVLTLLCDGATSGQIGFAFGLAPDTIDQHIASAREKLGTRNRIELVSYALRHDLVPLARDYRPGVVEVLRDEGEAIEDLVFRYVSGDADRVLPETNRTALNQRVSDWAGSAWRQDLSPLVGALESATGCKEKVSFSGARSSIQEEDERYEWSGWVTWINDDHYLLVIETPLPSGDGKGGGR